MDNTQSDFNFFNNFLFVWIFVPSYCWNYSIMHNTIWFVIVGMRFFFQVTTSLPTHNIKLGRVIQLTLVRIFLTLRVF
jgi:hypothetical protein